MRLRNDDLCRTEMVLARALPAAVYDWFSFPVCRQEFACLFDVK